MKIQFITRRAPGVSNEQIAAMRPREAAAVWKLVASGVIREIWFCPERPAVIGMLECASIEEARATMRTLPMPVAGLIDFEFFTLLPYDQFGMLFDERFK